MVDKVSLILLAVFSLAGIAMLAFAGYTYFRGERARSWPTAQGTVTSSGVRESESKDSDGHISKTYHPQVEFKYSVAGQAYESTRIKVGLPSSRNQTAAATIAGRYPANTKVTVLYDPQDPAYGVLESGAPLLTVLSFATGGVFASGVALYLYFGFIQWPQK